MRFIIPSQILNVIGQQTAYMASLSWLAWRSERASGDDALHLIIALGGAVWFFSFLIDLNFFPPVLVILMSAALGNAIDVFWTRSAGHVDRKYSLARVIVAASLALIVFDWATSHARLSLPSGGFGARNLALLAAGVAWLGILIYSRSRPGWMLRLGARNRWAMEYWARPLPAPPVVVRVFDYLCWVAVLILPMATTGLLSLTILEDVAISILVARLASTRGAMLVLAACLILAALRAAAGFTFVSHVGPPLVEAIVFACLLFWLRCRGRRTAWREPLGR